MKNITTIISKSGIGVFPTDTLYGVIGSAFSKKAVERIYAVKGRNHTKPFIVLISSLRDLEKCGVDPSLIRANRRILESHWPGKVSIILPVKKTNLKKFAYLHRQKNSLAFRMPKNKKLGALLEKTGPLVAPSANPESLPPAETITKAKKYFGNAVDFYVVGGKKAGKPSTILALKKDGVFETLR